MIGNLENKNPESSYKPSDAIREFTSNVQSDYQTGQNILTKSWTELNDHSVIEDMNNGQKMFNAFVDESFENPNDAWKYRGTRSKARNKGIVMHANLTTSYLLPSFKAQNEDDEVDREMSDFMTDLVEWMCECENSNYKENFLNVVFAMMHDPIVYLSAEWNEIMQTIKIKSEDGKYTKKEILDEVMSGFNTEVWNADQILLSNAFQRNIQKQKFVGKRKWIEYTEAEAKYGEHDNWEFVKPGVMSVFNGEDNLFYDIVDDEHPTMVEEFTYLNRREDIEVCFLGGIYMGDENIENNPIKHRDNFYAPRYNIQQFGYYPIGTKFIFYKSMMNTMRWDNALYDSATEIVANRAILEAEFPIAISGTNDDGQFDGGIAFPNAVVVMGDKDAKVQKLLPDSNLSPLLKTLQDTSDSMSDSSVNETMSGQLPEASQKAYSVSQAQQGSRKIIGGVAKGFSLSIARFGSLIKDIAIHNLSIPQIDEIVGDSTKLKYRKFILSNKNIGGKEGEKHLEFDGSLVGAEMTDQQIKSYGLKMLERTGYPDKTKDIIAANPEIFAKLKYSSISDYNELFKTDDKDMQVLLQGLYAQLRADPLLDAEALLRELMYSFFKGKGEKFVVKNTQKPMLNAGQNTQAPQNNIGNQIMNQNVAKTIATQ
jgi:hypothetical protein